MFSDLSPIEQLDTILTYMAQGSTSRTTISNFRHEFKIEHYQTTKEIIGRLLKDGYIDFDTPEPFLGGSESVYDITFDGRLFQSIGGYKNQQSQIEELNVTNAQNENKRVSNERRLLYGTWFAGIAAGLVLLWYIFVYFYPPHSECDFFYH